MRLQSFLVAACLAAYGLIGSASANGELALFNALMEIPDDAAQFIETFRDVGGQLGAEAVMRYRPTLFWEVY